VGKKGTFYRDLQSTVHSELTFKPSDFLSCGNPPVPLELKTILQLHRFELRQAESFEHKLVMYLLKKYFG